MYGWSVNVGPSMTSERKARPAAQGLIAGTLVGCEDGWRPVESLAAGDLVWTFDNGLQPVQRIHEHALQSNSDNPNLEVAVFRVPSGGLANEEELVFLPGTGLLLECENASDEMGDPFAVVPVDALEGVCGIERDTAPEAATLHMLVFKQEEAFYIDSGLMVVSRPSRSTQAAENTSNYEFKSVSDAKEMLTDLDLAELALREPEEEFFGEMASVRVA